MLWKMSLGDDLPIFGLYFIFNLIFWKIYLSPVWYSTFNLPPPPVCNYVVNTKRRKNTKKKKNEEKKTKIIKSFSSFLYRDDLIKRQTDTKQERKSFCRLIKKNIFLGMQIKREVNKREKQSGRYLKNEIKDKRTDKQMKRQNRLTHRRTKRHSMTRTFA